MATEKKNTWTKKNYTQEQLDGLSRRLNEMMEQGQEDKKTKKSYARSNLQEVTKRQNEMIAEAEARRKQRIKERRGMMPANKRKHTLASRKEDKEVLKEFYEVFNRKRDLEKPIKRRGEGISNALRGSRKKERTMGRMTEQAKKGIEEALERDRNTTTIGNLRRAFNDTRDSKGNAEKLRNELTESEMRVTERAKSKNPYNSERPSSRANSSLRTSNNEPKKSSDNATTIGNIKKAFDSASPELRGNIERVTDKRTAAEIRRDLAQQKANKTLSQGVKSKPSSKDRGYEGKRTTEDWRKERDARSKQLGKDSDLSSFRFDKKFRFIGHF